MGKVQTGLLVLFGSALFIAWLFMFTVSETERAIRFQLGRIVQSDYEPGLHFKVPLLQTVGKFDARMQTLDAEAVRYLTKEKKNVIVDSYVKWRIIDVEQFYVTTEGDYSKASNLIHNRISEALRNEFGNRTIQEVVSGERTEIMDILTSGANDRVQELGIEILDVRVKRIDLPDEVSHTVYNRMRAERERVSRDLRSKGAEAAERIRADADRQRTVILAEAYREAEITRGEGDAKAAEIYSLAFNKNAEFYKFYRSLNAYKNTFGNHNDILVLQPESDFFNYFKDSSGKK